MPATVIAEPERLFLEGVPSFTYREGRDSLVLALIAAARSLGRAIPYATLKGHSALAFRLIFHEDWHRYSPDALSGFDHTTYLLDALGLTGTLIKVDGTDPASVGESKEIIRRSLSDGYPILGIHLMDYEDWGVVTGITSNGKLICQTPHNTSDQPEEHHHWPSLLLRINGEGKIPDPNALLFTALRAAELLNRTRRFGPFYSGRAAYRYWIDSLRDVVAFERLEAREDMAYPDWIRGLHYEDRDNFALDARYASPYLERAHVNAWRTESLIDARSGAATYLAQAAEGFSGKAKTRLTRAADFYTQETALLVNTRQLVSWEWNLAENPWTPEKRAAQADALTAALALDNAAIKEIHAFLSKIS